MRQTVGFIAPALYPHPIESGFPAPFIETQAPSKQRKIHAEFVPFGLKKGGGSVQNCPNTAGSAHFCRFSRASNTRQGIKKPSETCWNTVSDGLSNEKSNGVLFLLGTHAFQTATQCFIGVGHVFQTGELECQHGGVCRIGAAFGIEQIQRTGHAVFVAQIG